MPFTSVRLRPGISVEMTPTLNEAGYQSSNWGRFRAGLFEKLGGWAKFYASTVTGVRALWAWQDFNGTARLAAGATSGLFVLNSAGTTISTITPQTTTTNLAVTTGGGAPTFLKSGSTGVQITDSGVCTGTTGVTVYDTVEFLLPVAFGGATLSGAYPITSINPGVSYTIDTGVTLLDGATNGAGVPLFTTLNGSYVVTVTWGNVGGAGVHGLSVGDVVAFGYPTTVGGVTVSAGVYSVVTVPSTTTFTIAVSTVATSTATVTANSGSARMKYSIGLAPAGYIGTGSVTQTSGSTISATDWTVDNWGETLLACPANGNIYAWTPSTSFQTAQPIGAAPAYNSGIFVATPAQILIAYGCAVDKTIGVYQDLLTYSWSDQLDYNYWTIGETNPTTGIASQAGTNRIPTGSAIKAAISTPQQTLMLTDLDAWAISYLGPPLVFGQIKIGSGCGAISRHCVTSMSGGIYWMGRNNFFAMAGGGPQVIPCTVWDTVFQDLDTSNLDKVWAQPVSSFNEIFFFYPSASGATGQCDKYVKVNVVEQTWDYGSIAASAGIDGSVVSPKPIMAHVDDSFIYLHESGYNANGSVLASTMTTGYFMLSDGEDFVFVDQWLPDWKYTNYAGSTTSATITVTFNVIDYPTDTPRTYGPYTMSTSVNKLDVRFRGRQVSFTITSTNTGSWFRIGRCRFRIAPAGRR